MCEEVCAQCIDIMVVVIALISRLTHDSITCREVEHNDIIELYLTQTLHTTIVPMWPRDIALSIDNWQGVLCQRHCQWCLRNTRTITYLRNKEVIARKERLLKGRRRNNVVLEEEQIDEIDCYQCKYQCIYPSHNEADRTLRILPPLPTNLLCDIYVIDKWND